MYCMRWRRGCVQLSDGQWIWQKAYQPDQRRTEGMSGKVSEWCGGCQSCGDVE